MAGAYSTFQLTAKFWDINNCGHGAWIHFAHIRGKENIDASPFQDGVPSTVVDGLTTLDLLDRDER